MPDIALAQRKQQQEDLTELQSEHARKRKKLVTEQDGEIQQIKQDFVGKKAATLDQGQASVNHIKKTQNTELEHAQENRQKLQQKVLKETSAVEDSYKNKIDQIKESRQGIVDRVRADTQKKVNETEAFSGKKVEEVRNRSNNEIRLAQERYNKQIENLDTSTKNRIAEINQQSDEAIQRELATGSMKKEAVRENNQKDVTQLQNRGQQAIYDETKTQENRKVRLDKDYEKQFQRQQEQWMSKETRLQEDYNAKLENNKNAYDDQLKSQGQHFKSKYSSNDNANRTTLAIQSNNYVKEMNEQKKEFLTETTKYSGKEKDPFYKVQDRGSQIQENENSYVIRAYVPAHEKDAVKITVQKDKATVEGKRAFKDQFETDDKKVATATYQSFREDFNFEKPVATKGMTRQRDGDYMIITVPKILNINRKA